MGLHMGSCKFGLYHASAEQSLNSTVKGINFFRNHPCSSSVAGEQGAKAGGGETRQGLENEWLQWGDKQVDKCKRQ